MNKCFFVISGVIIFESVLLAKPQPILEPGIPLSPGGFSTPDKRETYADRQAQREALQLILSNKPELYQTVRDYLTTNAKAKEKVQHYRILLAALRQFANNNDLPNNKPEPLLPNAPNPDEQVATVRDALAFASGYNVIYDMPKVNDISKPTFEERKELQAVLDALFQKLEDKVIAELVNRQVAPLLPLLKQAMDLPRATYVDQTGIQREAIPEIALKISREIDAYRDSVPLHRREISRLYYNMRVFNTVKEFGMDYPQAERAVDKWFERRWLEMMQHQRTQESKSRNIQRRSP